MKSSPLSLRTKLILSYVGVALGTTVILIIAIALAVQQYFINFQYQQLRQQVEIHAQDYERYYAENGNSWNGLARLLGFGYDEPSPTILIIVDKNGNQIACRIPLFSLEAGGPHYSYGVCNDPTISKATAQALNGQINNGQFQTFMKPIYLRGDDAPFSQSPGESRLTSLYVSEPLQVGNQTIGAIFQATPQAFQLPGQLVDQVNQTILITGIAVAFFVFLFGLILAHHFTQPLKALTGAAEQMKKGRYTQRVTPPKSLDELGRLALTFNEMADTIEADVNELRHQDQMRRDLVANIAHDLATPLTSIQGFSEALADDVISNRAERQETAQRIGREVQRLRRLVADVQQMSSLEAGTARLDLAPLDLRSLVDETLFVIEPECEQTGITIRNDLPSTIQPVLADSDRITQVLLNLLDNSRRHTPRGGKITVGAFAQRSLQYVWVSDSGSGIDQADLPHIFERFYRADRARTGTTGGSGLGLSIVKAIITAHGGAIWAESAPGAGTRITFTLPIAAQASEQSSEATNNGATGPIQPGMTMKQSR